MEKKTGDVFVETKLEEREETLRNQAERIYNEDFYTEGRPEWITTLYFQIDKLILGLKPGQMRKEFLMTYIKYSYKGILLTYLTIAKTSEKLKLWVKCPYQELSSVPLFVRDYSSQGRKPGIMISFDDERQYKENQGAMMRVVSEILKKAITRLNSQKMRNLKTPLQVKTEPVPEVVANQKFTLNLELGTDGFATLKFRMHGSTVPEFMKKIL